MATTVVALMENIDDARDVVQELTNRGFERDSIGMMSRDTGEGPKPEGAGEVASGAIKGAGAGAALGGTAGLLVGLAALPIPGIGPIIAAGPIAAALAGAGMGAVAGGGIGALTNLGIPEDEAQSLAEGVRRGGVLVTVNAEDNAMANQAVEIMRSQGAVNIEERAEQWRAGGWTGGTAANMAQESPSVEEQEEQVIPVAKEEMRVGKQQMERGGVRVYSYVVEKPVEETVRLQEERVDVERRPVDRPASAAGEELFQEQTFEVRETVEQPVVHKETRVTEEVVIGKETSEREQTVRGTVRETEVDVEPLGGSAEEQEEAASRRDVSYGGPERRRNTSVYTGVERRAA